MTNSFLYWPAQPLSAFRRCLPRHGENSLRCAENGFRFFEKRLGCTDRGLDEEDNRLGRQDHGFDSRENGLGRSDHGRRLLEDCLDVREHLLNVKDQSRKDKDHGKCDKYQR
jgi:hypothetical protein